MIFKISKNDIFNEVYIKNTNYEYIFLDRNLFDKNLWQFVINNHKFRIVFSSILESLKNAGFSNNKYYDLADKNKIKQYIDKRGSISIKTPITESQYKLGLSHFHSRNDTYKNLISIMVEYLDEKSLKHEIHARVSNCGSYSTIHKIYNQLFNFERDNLAIEEVVKIVSENIGKTSLKIKKEQTARSNLFDAMVLMDIGIYDTYDRKNKKLFITQNSYDFDRDYLNNLYDDLNLDIAIIEENND